MKYFLVTAALLATLVFGFFKGEKTASYSQTVTINQLEAENQNLEYKLNQCMILYRGQ